MLAYHAMFLSRFFRPAPHIERRPESEWPNLFRSYRWAILEATFIGYSIFYFVRTNFGVVSHELGQAVGYSKTELGWMLTGLSLAYAVGKFVNGSLSDRSNPRIFMPVGLLLTAGCNLAFGSVHSFGLHLSLWTLNGFVQGMGWPPCGRSLGHWYSLRERGFIFAIWNTAHNVGGALIGIIAAYSAAHWGWQYAFYVPAAIAIVTAVYLMIRLRDTPQSVGLPPIEEFKNDWPEKHMDHEKELSTRELFVQYVLTSKAIWALAIANFFVYIARYAMLSWGPTFLKEVKGASLETGGWSAFIYEGSAIFSTIFVGWLSDKVDGRRALLSLVCMFPVLGAFIALLYAPPGSTTLPLLYFAIIGAFIYPPVMLLGVAALDFSSKKAVGTAAGFVGLFGYAGTAAQSVALGYLADHYGWDSAIGAIIVCALMAIVLLMYASRFKPTS